MSLGAIHVIPDVLPLCAAAVARPVAIGEALPPRLTHLLELKINDNVARQGFHYLSTFWDRLNISLLDLAYLPQVREIPDRIFRVFISTIFAWLPFFGSPTRSLG